MTAATGVTEGPGDPEDRGTDGGSDGDGGGGRGGTFLALRNRNFRLYFRGQLVSNTGNWLTNVAITLLVLDITDSGLAVGLLAACQYGPILLLSAWAGAIADRLDKRRLLIVTQSLEMVQSFALAAVAFLPDPSIGALYVLAAFGGTLLAFDNPLRRSFVSEMVPPEDIPNAVVLYSTIVNVSRIFGPALAGLLVVTLGYGWAFAIDGASYLTVLASLAMMRPHELYREPPKPRSRGEVRAGLRYVRSLPHLWITFAMLGAIGTISYNFNVTLPLFVTDALDGTEGEFTILYSVFSVGAVSSALIVARRRMVRIDHIVRGAVALGIAMLLLSIVPGVAAGGPAVFLVGMASVLYMTATTSIVQVEAKHEMHGRVLALQTVVLIGTAPIGGPILGWVSDALGARWPLVLGGVVSLLTAGFGAWATRRFAGDDEVREDEVREGAAIEVPAAPPTAEPVRTLGRDDDEIGV